MADNPTIADATSLRDGLTRLLCHLAFRQDHAARHIPLSDRHERTKLREDARVSEQIARHLSDLLERFPEAAPCSCCAGEETARARIAAVRARLFEEG